MWSPCFLLLLVPPVVLRRPTWSRIESRWPDSNRMESFCYLWSVLRAKEHDLARTWWKVLESTLILQYVVIIWGIYNNNQIRWNMFCGKVSKIGHVTWGHLIYEMLGRPAHMQSFWAYLEDTAGIRNAIAALSNESSQKCTLVDQFHFNTWCDDFSACHHRQRSAGAFLYGRHSERLHSSRLQGGNARTKGVCDW